MRLLALVVFDQPTAGFHVTDTSVRQHKAEIQPMADAGLYGFVKRSFNAFTVIRMYLGEGVCALHGFDVAKKSGVGGTVVEPPAFQIKHCNKVFDVLGNHAKEFFLGTHGFLSQSAFGDVGQHDAHHGYLASSAYAQAIQPDVTAGTVTAQKFQFTSQHVVACQYFQKKAIPAIAILRGNKRGEAALEKLV